MTTFSTLRGVEYHKGVKHLGRNPSSNATSPLQVHRAVRPLACTAERGPKGKIVCSCS